MDSAIAQRTGCVLAVSSSPPYRLLGGKSTPSQRSCHSFLSMAAWGYPPPCVLTVKLGFAAAASLAVIGLSLCAEHRLRPVGQLASSTRASGRQKRMCAATDAIDQKLDCLWLSAPVPADDEVGRRNRGLSCCQWVVSWRTAPPVRYWPARHLQTSSWAARADSRSAIDQKFDFGRLGRCAPVAARREVGRRNGGLSCCQRMVS